MMDIFISREEKVGLTQSFFTDENEQWSPQIGRLYADSIMVL
jgi:hypothetical protein